MRIDEVPKARQGGMNDWNGRSSAEFHPSSSLTRSRSGLAQRRENEIEGGIEIIKANRTSRRWVWDMAPEAPPPNPGDPGQGVKFQTLGGNRQLELSTVGTLGRGYQKHM